GLLAPLGGVPFRRPPGELQARRRAVEILELVGLGARADRPAVELPYGEQRRLEIARALASAPRMLLLDEPSAGMNPQETLELRAGRGGPTPPRAPPPSDATRPSLPCGSARARRSSTSTQRSSASAQYGSAMLARSPLLEVEDLHVSYGKIRAVQGVSLAVPE